jgi:hypothetical protein
MLDRQFSALRILMLGFGKIIQNHFLKGYLLIGYLQLIGMNTIRAMMTTDRYLCLMINNDWYFL